MFVHSESSLLENWVIIVFKRQQLFLIAPVMNTNDNLGVVMLTAANATSVKPFGDQFRGVVDSMNIKLWSILEDRRSNADIDSSSTKKLINKHKRIFIHRCARKRRQLFFDLLAL
jgi:hypothetical protein